MADPRSSPGPDLAEELASLLLGAGNASLDGNGSWPGGGGGGGGFNMSLEAYLMARRGPKHLPLRVVLPITAVYAVIAVTGLVGNMAVCAVIVRTPELHTATNYYLFSLAVSDLLLLLLGLPNDLAVFWQQYPWPLGEALCKARAVVSEMMSYTSVLTIVAFSMERYLAICHPLYSYSMKGLRRALRIIAAVWLVSLASAAPFAAYTTVDYIDYPPGSGNIVEESAFCAMLVENVPAGYPVYEISSLVFFFLPILVMVALYARMALAIWRPRGLRKRVQGSVHRRARSQAQTRSSIVRMLAAVVVAFFLCWAPFHLQRLLYIYGRESPNFSEINEWMYYITGCFYYFSSTINPILYNVMSARYRDAFFKTLCCMSTQQNIREPSSFQETSVCYTSSVYGRNAARYNHHSVYRDNEVQIKSSDRVENYCAIYNNHCESSPPDVVVVSANGKTESIVTPKSKHTRDWPTPVARTDAFQCDKEEDESIVLRQPLKTNPMQEETCI